jgi:hypothetical protein
LPSSLTDTPTAKTPLVAVAVTVPVPSVLAVAADPAAYPLTSSTSVAVASAEVHLAEKSTTMEYRVEFCIFVPSTSI